MDDIDRRIIEIYLDDLADKTNFNHLFRELEKKENIITPHMRNKFRRLQENGVENNTLNKELYKNIQTRGKTAFDILVQCLKPIHPDLVELLLPGEESEPLSVFEEEEDISNHNEQLSTEYKGICTVIGNQPIQSDLRSAVQKLCYSIKAKWALTDVALSLTEDGFHIGIQIGRKFKEEDILCIGSLYTNQSSPKIILINIISEELDNTPERSPDTKESSNGNPPAVFIVNIHIHKGDHPPSVINIIKEVVSHNPGYEIRDIFCVVMEKLVRWGCRLNTESRNFPKFYF